MGFKAPTLNFLTHKIADCNFRVDAKMWQYLVIIICRPFYRIQLTDKTHAMLLEDGSGNGHRNCGSAHQLVCKLLGMRAIVGVLVCSTWALLLPFISTTPSIMKVDAKLEFCFHYPHIMVCDIVWRHAPTG